MPYPRIGESTARTTKLEKFFSRALFVTIGTVLMILVALLDGSGNKMPLYGTPSLVDSDISWQEIETLDFGVDLRFFSPKACRYSASNCSLVASLVRP